MLHHFNSRDMDRVQHFFAFKSFEKCMYLDILLVQLQKKLLKFRTSNHRLHVETGRRYSTPLNERLCIWCNLRLIGDEFYYILECSALKEMRKNI